MNYNRSFLIIYLYCHICYPIIVDQYVIQQYSSIVTLLLFPILIKSILIIICCYDSNQVKLVCAIDIYIIYY